MKHSNLAERLEEFEAVIESLNLTDVPSTQKMGGPAAGEESQPLPRRTSRRSRIEIRDQGLRPFRVC